MPLAHARINAVQHATWCRACHLAASAAYATAFWTLLPSECCCCIVAVPNSLPVRAKCVLVLAHYGCADCTCISNHTTSYHLSHGLNRLHARATHLHPHIINTLRTTSVQMQSMFQHKSNKLAKRCFLWRFRTRDPRSVTQDPETRDLGPETHDLVPEIRDLTRDTRPETKTQDPRPETQDLRPET